MKSGPCVKQRVICTIVSKSGTWRGENSCRNAQEVCPRADLPTGQGYELCRDICQQVGHAEVVAAAAAGTDAHGGTAYLEGHTYACEPCKSALAAVGVTEIIIGSPPL